jgi:hypothetical protein
VYEAFFTLSWAEERVVGETARVRIGALESWPRSVQQLQSQTLPAVRRTAENPAVAEEMKVPALIGWLINERDDLSTMLRSPAAAPLVKDLPQRATSAAQGGVEYRTWEGASAIDVLGLASARRAEERLGVEFPSGPPDSDDQIRWLRFNALSLQLAMLIDQVKAAAFKTQLVRQITEETAWGCCFVCGR